MPKLVCLPDKDTEKRFVLGICGQKNLLCIGLNPNTANAENLDPTAKNFMRISKENGFDGWALVNLYPARCSKGKYLDPMADPLLLSQNIAQIKEILDDPNWSIEEVLVAWGNDIVYKPYLWASLQLIHELFQLYPLRYYAFRTNTTGHPGHPSPMTLNTKYKPGVPLKLHGFDLDGYLSTHKPLAHKPRLHKKGL